ncbi:UNVERIFIED_CONTAM: WRKY DNA-binding transcription factor 70 [Sesamum calycinum]|uniref:WRKY DNA-binding transcription factor 70 n=1 Tax=Sesamum calycinum TaxID=2727403 RepID=A0AAW2LR14_9LAMI
MVVELLKGRDKATRLRALLQDPRPHQHPVSAEQLAVEIFRSFSESLSVLSSGVHVASAQIPAVDSGGSSSCSGDSKKKPGVKDRRGCYKRRRTADTRVIVSSTMEDGCAWRKYGQKVHPQVRRLQSYKTGAENQRGSHHVSDHILQQTYMQRNTKGSASHHPFRSDRTQSDQFPSTRSTGPHPSMIHTVKQESYKGDNLSEDQDLSDDQAKSSLLQDPWQDIMGGLESSGYKPAAWTSMILSSSYQEEVASAGFHHSSDDQSAGLHGLDLEVDQLGDIDNILPNCFDDLY